MHAARGLDFMELEVEFEYDAQALAETLESYSLSLDTLVGQGSTALVFARGERVCRLTMDYASHHFLVEAAKTAELAVPEVFVNHGEVHRYTDDAWGESLYLLECERLEALEHWREQSALVNEWLGYIDENHPTGTLVTGSESERQELMRLLRNLVVAFPEQLRLPGKMQKTLLFAIDRFGMRLCDIELSDTNFMVRPSTGQILLTDPVHD